MLVDLGAKLDLFDLHRGLVLAGALCLHLLLVLELAIVHDPAHGRVGIWCDLNEIERLLICDSHRIRHVENAELRTVLADEATSRRTNTIVDSRLSRANGQLTSTIGDHMDRTPEKKEPAGSVPSGTSSSESLLDPLFT